MPANLVTGRDAEAVARFVARYAGSEAPETPTIENPAAKRMKAGPVGANAATLPPRAVTDQAFLRAAFDSAQSLWARKFEAAGLRYDPGHLIFFHTVVDTPCGMQSAETGPF
jgi:predicted metalloprotease